MLLYLSQITEGRVPLPTNSKKMRELAVSTGIAIKLEDAGIKSIGYPTSKTRYMIRKSDLEALVGSMGYHISQDQMEDAAYQLGYI